VAFVMLCRSPARKGIRSSTGTRGCHPATEYDLASGAGRVVSTGIGPLTPSLVHGAGPADTCGGPSLW